jgi:hypothetical protein
MGENGVTSFLQGDLSHWDRSLCAYFITTVWQAIQIVYDLPESEMVLCAIYNAFAPLILPDHGDLKVYQKSGIQPSGSGGFVPVNHLLNFLFQILSIMNLMDENEDADFDMLLEEALKIMGQVYGDDFFCPNLAGAEVWAKILYDSFGVVMKPSQTLVSERVVVMTSRIYDLETGLVGPIIMRRARNALCPKHDPMPNAWDEELGRKVPKEDESRKARIKVAVSYRSQSEEILSLANQGVPGYERLREFWETSVCPIDRTLPELSIVELAREAQLYGVSYDSLTYIRTYR